MVNALSEWANVEVVRGGKRHRLGFRRGKTQGGLVTEEIDGGDDEAQAGGTTVTFKPDPEVKRRKYGRFCVNMPVVILALFCDGKAGTPNN